MGTAEIVIILIILILPLAAMFDLMRQTAFKKNKTLWGLIIIFLPLIGPIVYLVFTRYTYMVKKDL